MHVWEDRAQKLETNNSPKFLGLLSTTDGLRGRYGLRGKGIIIGMIDSGAVQEHPSYDDTGMDPPTNWSGACQAGEGWAVTDCSNKLIGARWFAAGFQAGATMEPNDFLSPRDSDGHGTHTSTTAAGRITKAFLNGRPVAMVGGMAPLAYLSIYKACYQEQGGDPGASCFFSDSAAAADTAVADGVDIISFSIGSNFGFDDPVDIAFLNAADAGVFVAQAAGNEGPGPFTTAAGEPWVTTVAASTQSGSAFAQATRVNAPASIAADYASFEAVFTPPLTDVGPLTRNVAAADPIDACTPLAAGSLNNRIALVARGACNFDLKVANASLAGAKGVIVYSQAGNPKVPMAGVPTADTQIPAVIVDNFPGKAMKHRLEALAVDRPSATLSGTIFVTEELTGNIMAGFSSAVLSDRTGLDQAGRDGAGRPDPRGRYAGAKFRHRRRILPVPAGHFDVDAARVGHRGAHQAEASGLVAGHDQVVAHDDRAPQPRQGRRRDAGRSVRLRRGPHRPEQGDRSGPRLRRGPVRLPGGHLRH